MQANTLVMLSADPSFEAVLPIELNCDRYPRLASLAASGYEWHSNNEVCSTLQLQTRADAIHADWRARVAPG